MKKIIKILCLLSMTVLCVFTASCTNNENNSSGGYNYIYSLSISKAEMSLEKNDTEYLVAAYSDNFTKPTFRSTDETVATVTADGLVTAVSAGTCYITVEAAGESRSCKVNVTDPQYTIELVYNDNVEWIAPNAKIRIVAKLFKDGVPYDGKVTFTSENSACKIEVGENNTIIFSAPVEGDYTIVANSGKATATCTLSVKSLG